MNLKAFAIVFALIFSSCVPTQIFGAGPRKPTIQDLTPEDIEALDQMTKQIKAQMKPEELAEYEALERHMQEEVAKMSPEQQEELFTQALQEIMKEPAIAEYLPMQQPVVQEIAPIAPPQPEIIKEEPTKVNPKQDAAIRRIDSIIYHTNEFLKKINTMIEFPGKLKKWSEQGKIKGWKSNYTWTDIKNKIENLTAKLGTAKRRNSKTGAYPYINLIVEDESLYNNLGKLQSSLAELEPKIIIESFGATPATRPVRELIRKLLAVYVEALFDLKIPADLNKAFEKIKPEDAKILEQEKKAAEKATEESKKIRPYKPTVTSGSAAEEPGYTPNYSDYSSAGYSPYNSYSPYNDYSSSYGAAPAPAATPAAQPSSSSSSSGGGRGGSSSAPAEKAEKMATPEESAKQTAAQTSGGPGKQAATESVARPYKQATTRHKEANPKIRNLLSTFDASLTEAEGAISSSPILTKLNDTIYTGELTKEDELTIHNNLSQAIKGLEKADGALQSLKKLYLAKLKDDLRQGYKQEVEDLYNENKKLFTQLVEEIKEIKKNEQRVSDTKKRGYLGLKTAQPLVAPTLPAADALAPQAALQPQLAAQTAPQLTEPDVSFSLYRLQEVIEKLQKTIKSL